MEVIFWNLYTNFALCFCVIDKLNYSFQDLFRAFVKIIIALLLHGITFHFPSKIGAS